MTVDQAWEIIRQSLLKEAGKDAQVAEAFVVLGKRVLDDLHDIAIALKQR